MVKCQVAEARQFLGCILGWALWGGHLGWALWGGHLHFGVGTLGLVLVVSLFWDHIQGVLLISQHLCSCFGVDLKFLLLSPINH